ncbi:TPA: peptide chain release factor 1, partial [Candidatus Saccharibacteria bacterium]|nr:peptide chain release factor 1 [Candidatus Saccharibacteria bacterium]
MDSKEKSLREELSSLQSKLQSRDVYSSKDYPALARRYAELQSIVKLFDEKKQLELQLEQTKHMVVLSDTELAELAKTEQAELEAKLAQNEEKLTEALLPKDPNDERDAIVEIRAAAGGDEASLFAGDLYRMYVRWCERKGLKTELVSESPSEAGGFKEIIFAVRGENAYQQLKFEAGVHRVQRVPVTESSGRIHTSTVTVAVLPEAEEADIEIKPEETRVDVFRSSGPGGQSVNTTDS